MSMPTCRFDKCRKRNAFLAAQATQAANEVLDNDIHAGVVTLKALKATESGICAATPSSQKLSGKPAVALHVKGERTGPASSSGSQPLERRILLSSTAIAAASFCSSFFKSLQSNAQRLSAALTSFLFFAISASRILRSNQRRLNLFSKI